MDNKILATESIDEFIDALIEMRGLIPLDKHLLHLLFEIKSDIPLHTQKFLTLCMSLLDDGNTRVPLEALQFTDMWTRKWNGLVMLRISTAEEDIDERAFATADDFASIITNGIQDLLTSDFSAIMESRETDTASTEDSLSKPFILAKRESDMHLYFTKHFDAKCVIEKAANILFKNGSKPTDEEIAQCTEKIASICKPFGDKPFLIKKRQAEAIIRGQTENLVVTGGPGTGKTTVVLYILWNLLASHSEMLDWNIYLAAPSGKAADRMRESLIDGLTRIRDEQKTDNERIFRKLNELESSTIHRLLRFSKSKGGFMYNHEEQFPKNSIFVIDEASMIDIEMFAALLEAIPEGARLFILGDPFQLPSVDSGAVLGEILKVQSGKDFSVKLNESNRFDDRSNIGKLATEIKEVAESKDNNKFVPHKFVSGDAFDDLANENSATFKDKVFYRKLETDNNPLTKKEEDKRIESFIAEWSRDFAKLPELAEQINPQRTGTEADDPDHSETARRNQIWQLSLTKRILCAERRGLRGIENINKKVCSKIKSLWRAKKKSQGETVQWDDSGYFPGQLLIITRNQEMFKLYNGDTGIVVFDGNTPCLMLKKAPPQGSERTRDDFVFYPLSVLPEDSIATAFAITIHKSQGSEYKHVTMFLPTKIGHPLLTNQIIYTGITRAKESVTIIAGDETFKAAVTTISERDTGISL
ncbi:ATP-dependent DNA helicase [Fibrobacter succinogenes]|uniref:DNA helicase/exodeoxyribonuclease V, alpha subunit n=1 Tax=Fibrobacter succinogenes TaxID=833 RepID=A0A380S7B8_FIBSU|nr:AAA family ATPase [Fibrobacter succinogenes]PWJ35726.1 DNA helicase/exodeoxyribonuclease V alpha subunit [Fibrobacter succinogenes subsp. elongatus]SUQ24381.1 DNA helicase/exodeoxyribonuclease V, alpha subunit [Fibrobacter succinogenes]